MKIEIKYNLQIVDYLDVTLNLTDGTRKPYRKPNDESMYIHKRSNHPPNIIKQIPLSIDKRLSNLSSNKEIFDEAAEYYEKVLNKCAYKHKLTYLGQFNVMKSEAEVRGNEILYGSIMA